MAKRHSRKVSDATKFKMSIAKQGRKTKEKISKAMIEYWRTILPLNS